MEWNSKIIWFETVFGEGKHNINLFNVVQKIVHELTWPFFFQIPPKESDW